LGQPPDTSREQRRDVARVEAFSDGVFAFAITLLVITIRIPRLDDPDASVGLSTTRSASVAELHGIRHHFRGRLGIIWTNHRLMFSHVARNRPHPGFAGPARTDGRCIPPGANRNPRLGDERPQPSFSRCFSTALRWFSLASSTT